MKINWNKEEITELERILMNLSDDEAESVNWDSLPSMEMPDVDATEVWAMDVNGNCLCGLIHDIVEGRGTIKHIDQIRAEQN